MVNSQWNFLLRIQIEKVNLTRSLDIYLHKGLTSRQYSINFLNRLIVSYSQYPVHKGLTTQLTPYACTSLVRDVVMYTRGALLQEYPNMKLVCLDLRDLTKDMLDEYV